AAAPRPQSPSAWRRIRRPQLPGVVSSVRRLRPQLPGADPPVRRFPGAEGEEGGVEQQWGRGRLQTELKKVQHAKEFKPIVIIPLVKALIEKDKEGEKKKGTFVFFLLLVRCLMNCLLAMAVLCVICS
ncbi:Os07g0597400, partial [Oryza sativa Japonica Group]